MRDWRLKPYGGAGNIEVDASFQICCMRVLRITKRLDTFSPATGAHTANLLPIQYLWQKQQAMEMENKGDYEGCDGLFGCERCIPPSATAEPHLGESSKPTLCDLA